MSSTSSSPELPMAATDWVLLNDASPEESDSESEEESGQFTVSCIAMRSMSKIRMTMALQNGSTCLLRCDVQHILLWQQTGALAVELQNDGDLPCKPRLPGIVEEVAALCMSCTP